MGNLSRIAIDPDLVQGDRIILVPEQLDYLTRAIRLRDGDRFQAIDGRGNLYLAVLNDRTGQIIQITTDRSTELPIAVTLILALPKGGGFEDTIRMCVELGVVKIHPVIAERTQVKTNLNKLDRWHKIVKEAVEQCERIYIPEITQIHPFAVTIESIEKDSHCYICESRGDLPHLLDCLPQVNSTDSSLLKIVIAIGPEGGWTRSELDLALACGFQPVSLGRRILRALTAPVTVMSVIAGYYEDRRGRECPPL
jgi:16S rRNA (uracil1498-N3)-methyltransferase